MSDKSWMYATVEFVREKAQVTILMSDGNHRVTAVNSHDEAYTVIAQMGSEGWELTGTEQQIRTRTFTESTYTDVRRLWLKKRLKGME